MEVTDEDKALYEELRHLPDWECLPIPQSWYKKFNIPPRNPISVKDSIASNYAMKMAFAPKDLPPIIINEPQQGGKLLEMMPPEEIPVEVISRPFEEDITRVAVLPLLTELTPESEQKDEFLRHTDTLAEEQHTLVPSSPS